MAFFKSFQESLSSVSVSSILDSVSSTVSNTVDGVKTAVSDVTYTVSDQLTEQVSTIINKKQGEDEDKGKRDEAEDSDSRTGAGERINSKRHAYADEEEERREREKQEQDRRNEEQQWEWCYESSKGWYRKRRDPNQRETKTEGQGNKQEKTGASGELSSDRDVKVTTARMENNGGGQEDTISKTSTETAHSRNTRTEQCPNFNHQTNGHAQEEHAQEGHAQKGHAQELHTPEEHAHEGHTQEGYAPEEHAQEGHAQEGYAHKGHAPEQHAQEGHAQEGYAPEEHAQEGHDDHNRDKAKRRNSMSTKPKQNTGDGASGVGAFEKSGVEKLLPQEKDSLEGSRSRSSSVLKEQCDKDEAMGSQGHLEVSEDKKDTEHPVKKERFRRCTLL